MNEGVEAIFIWAKIRSTGKNLDLEEDLLHLSLKPHRFKDKLSQVYSNSSHKY